MWGNLQEHNLWFIKKFLEIKVDFVPHGLLMFPHCTSKNSYIPPSYFSQRRITLTGSTIIQKGTHSVVCKGLWLPRRNIEAKCGMFVQCWLRNPCKMFLMPGKVGPKFLRNDHARVAPVDVNAGVVVTYIPQRAGFRLLRKRKFLWVRRDWFVDIVSAFFIICLWKSKSKWWSCLPFFPHDYLTLLIFPLDCLACLVWPCWHTKVKLSQGRTWTACSELCGVRGAPVASSCIILAFGSE